LEPEMDYDRNSSEIRGTRNDRIVFVLVYVDEVGTSLTNPPGKPGNGRQKRPRIFPLEKVADRVLVNRRACRLQRREQGTIAADRDNWRHVVRGQQPRPRFQGARRAAAIATVGGEENSQAHAVEFADGRPSAASYIAWTCFTCASTLNFS